MLLYTWTATVILAIQLHTIFLKLSAILSSSLSYHWKMHIIKRRSISGIHLCRTIFSSTQPEQASAEGFSKRMIQNIHSIPSALHFHRHLLGGFLCAEKSLENSYSTVIPHQAVNLRKEIVQDIFKLYLSCRNFPDISNLLNPVGNGNWNNPFTFAH